MKKQINHSILVFALPITIALVSLGCNLSQILPGSAGNDIETTPTRTPMPTFTPTPAGEVAFVDSDVAIETQPETQGQEQPVAEATETEVVPTEPPPTDTPEPTATPAPAVTILQEMNIRGGPGTNYPVVGAGAPGDSADVLGKNDDGSWFQIAVPNVAGGVAWIYGPLVQIVGNVDAVAVAEAPPPPPTPTPAPTDVPVPTPVPTKAYQFTPDGFWGTENAGIVHFKGRFRDEAGNLVNGYSVLIDNGAWSVVSHPSGASHHYPEKGDGEWDIVIPDPSTGVGWWWVTVVRYDCPDFFERFDAQCKQYTKLSEDIKVLINWPDETVLNANWTCHWDCDKGLYKDAYRRGN